MAAGTYGYKPGSENSCNICNGYLRWPDGIRTLCLCAMPEPCPPQLRHQYWVEKPYHTREEERAQEESRQHFRE